jgi:hypothetical protein
VVVHISLYKKTKYKKRINAPQENARKELAFKAMPNEPIAMSEGPADFQQIPKTKDPDIPRHNSSQSS